MYASPNPKPPYLPPYLSLPPSLPPSPNVEVGRQLFTGDYLSPKATPSPRKSKATPNYEAMDIEEDFKSKTTIA